VIQTVAERPIADLVVILDAIHERFRRERVRVRAPSLAAGGDGLPLVQPATRDGSGNAGRTGPVRAVIAVALTRQRHADLMVKVVGPHGVEAVFGHERSFVTLVLRDQESLGR
jgi:hypothetical protein